ncbi:MAG: hypothetical protein WCI92_20105 [Bacteroidota bacterium]
MKKLSFLFSMHLPFSSASGLPGAPTIGTATAGDAQASVSFTAPSNVTFFFTQL